MICAYASIAAISPRSHSWGDNENVLSEPTVRPPRWIGTPRMPPMRSPSMAAVSCGQRGSVARFVVETRCSLSSESIHGPLPGLVLGCLERRGGAIRGADVVQCLALVDEHHAGAIARKHLLRGLHDEAERRTQFAAHEILGAQRCNGVGQASSVDATGLRRFVLHGRAFPAHRCGNRRVGYPDEPRHGPALNLLDLSEPLTWRGRTDGSTR